MRFRQGILFAVLVYLAAITVRADGVPTDARIIVGHGGDPVSCGLPDFKVNANGNGGGIKNCQNTSGQDWIGLTITGTSKSGPINCDNAMDTVFTSCTFQIMPEPHNKQLVTITFSGGEITTNSVNCPMVLPDCADSFFFLNLNDAGGSVNGNGGWEGKLDVRPTVPEPGVIVLLLTGLGAIWLRSRRKSPTEIGV
jgi:hypothetical protein